MIGVEIILDRKLYELTLEELFPKTLFDTPCIYIDKGRDIWIVTEMCAEYLESTIDSIVVKDENNPIGTIGGYDILYNLRQNPTSTFFQTKIDEIFFKPLPQVNEKIKLVDLIEGWKKTRRAFSVIANPYGDYFSISARKLLEVGKQYKSGVSVSSIPKKKIISFKGYESLGTILDIMFKNYTRKIVLENSNQFVSDRLILGEISNLLKFQEIDNLLNTPINQFRFEYAKEITTDLTLNQICLIMDKMDHPCILYQDSIVTPWDVCLILLSENLTEFSSKTYQQKKICPHCRKEID